MHVRLHRSGSQPSGTMSHWAKISGLSHVVERQKADASRGPIAAPAKTATAAASEGRRRIPEEQRTRGPAASRASRGRIAYAGRGIDTARPSFLASTASTVEKSSSPLLEATHARLVGL